MTEQTNIISGDWPGAWGIYKRSKEAVQVNIGSLLGLIGVFILVSIFSGIVLSSFGVKNDSPLQSVVDLIVSSAATVSFTLIILAGIRGQKLDLQSSLKACLSTVTLKVILLSLLTGAIVALSLLLLIIPFFFVMPRITLASYFLIDQKMGVLDSISASWNATKGSVGKVWGIIGVSLLFGIAILVLVGIYFSIMYAASFGILYTYLTKKQPKES